MSDRRARRELERKLGEAGIGGGRQVWDASGAALYQLEPAWATTVICYRCLYVGLMPTIPARPLAWRCSQCGHQVTLDPPAEVLEATRPPGSLILPSSRRRLV